MKQPACRPVGVADIKLRRLLLEVYLHGEFIALCKSVPRRWKYHVRRGSRYGIKLLLSVKVGCGGEEGPGVGMCRLIKYLLGKTVFDYFTCAITAILSAMLQQRQVVGNEDNRACT